MQACVNWKTNRFSSQSSSDRTQKDFVKGQMTYFVAPLCRMQHGRKRGKKEILVIFILHAFSLSWTALEMAQSKRGTDSGNIHWILQSDSFQGSTGHVQRTQMFSRALLLTTQTFWSRFRSLHRESGAAPGKSVDTNTREKKMRPEVI